MDFFFWKSNKRAGGKVLKRGTISDNFGSEFALCSALFEMKCTLYHVIISLVYSVAVPGVFRENEIKEQMGQNPKINKQAGENKSKQRGQNVETW